MERELSSISFGGANNKTGMFIASCNNPLFPLTSRRMTGCGVGPSCSQESEDGLRKVLLRPCDNHQIRAPSRTPTHTRWRCVARCAVAPAMPNTTTSAAPHMPPPPPRPLARLAQAHTGPCTAAALRRCLTRVVRWCARRTAGGTARCRRRRRSESQARPRPCHSGLSPIAGPLHHTHSGLSPSRGEGREEEREERRKRGREGGREGRREKGSEGGVFACPSPSS